MIQTEKRRNKSTLIFGISLGLIYVLYVSELMQNICANIFNASNAKLEFHYVYLISDYTFSQQQSSFEAVVISLAILLFAIIFIEISSLFIKKVSSDYYRFTLIVFQLVLMGYSLLYLLYETITVVIDINQKSDLNKLSTQLGVVKPYSLLLVFFIIFVFGAYLNFSSKIIHRYVGKKSTEKT